MYLREKGNVKKALALCEEARHGGLAEPAATKEQKHRGTWKRETYRGRSAFKGHRHGGQQH